MATYYISTTGVNDAGRNGGVGQEWATLSYACTRVTTPGDIIHVNAGSYYINSVVYVPVGITIEGDGNTSILIGNYYTASSSYGILSLYSYPTAGVNGAQEIRNIKLDGQNQTAYSAIVVFDRSNVKVHDVTIENFTNIGIYFRGSAVGSGGWNETIGSAPSIYESGNEIYNCILTNNGDNIRIHSQTDPLIHDNIITETKTHAVGTAGHILNGWGMWFKGLKFYNNQCYKNLVEPNGNWNFHFEVGTTHGGNEVYNNVFHNGTALDIASWENVKGDYEYSWWIHDNEFLLDRQEIWLENDHLSYMCCLEATCEDVIIERNYVENYPFAIGFDIAQTPRHMNNLRVRYNIFKNMGYSDSAGWDHLFMFQSYGDQSGTPVNYMRNIYIDNNVIHCFSRARSSFFLACTDEISNIYIRNNIVQNVNGYGWLVFWGYDDKINGTINNIYGQNNIVYNCINGIAPYYRSPQTSGTVGYSGSDNITNNPLFVSSNDFHLQSASPAIDAGINIGLNSDYENNYVPFNTIPDIGAYEYFVEGTNISISTPVVLRFGII